MTELLLGAGNNHARKIQIVDGVDGWAELITLDIDPMSNPDVRHDLAILPYPFPDNYFDEIHAYDVMEHVGQQGDWRFFFRQWDEIWRILKPGGHFAGISPGPESLWAWGDPGHTRIIGPQCLTYLDRNEYKRQVGKTPMTDYRFCYDGDFAVIHTQIMDNNQHMYVLKARKGDDYAG